MHKLPQPVKLWYLSSFFRRERPQKGRFRQFWQIGAEAIGSDDPAVDAETILLLAEILEALGVRARLRISSLGMPLDRLRYRDKLQAVPARERGAAVRGRRRADRAQPAARVRLRPPGHARGDGGRAAAARRSSTARTPSTSPTCARCSTRPISRTTSTPRSCAASTTTRARCSSSRRADLGAQSGVGGGGRYDGLIEQIGGPPTPGMGWARGRRADAAGRHARARAPRRRSTCSSRTPKPELRAAAFRLAADARRAGHAARLELGGRSLKGQLKQADRAGARYVAILGDEGTSLKDMETGEQQDSGGRHRHAPHRARSRCEAAARERRTATRGAASSTRGASARPCASPAGSTAGATTAG